MARLVPRVHYLAGFSCPVAGLAAGKPRVLRAGAEIFLSTGRELVHVYDPEGRQLTVSGGRGVPGRGAARRGGGEAARSRRLFTLKPPPALCLRRQAVYRFPAQVWHLEVLALRRALYVLCARRGIYCLSLDQASR